MENIEGDAFKSSGLDRGRPAGAQPHSTKMDISCALCRRRKVRCDRAHPCSNCSRADILCIYPERRKRSRQTKEPAMEEILRRISRVERTIAAFSPGQSADSIGCDPQLSSNLEYEAAGVLSKDGETSRYFNEALLQQILSQVRETPQYAL
ncbi:Zn(II)2Cys6 transcription factor domain-containing protein [Aspergillus fischeri NRRL 181]|uniref:C6 zinc finger domain protein n=1 Tax=Neosartorya fischeri (strain ATCC 1020 / DSM 3700 / CBS 544.65 / FGSC A1164 / JCM 1740 / NRRL 181 / WB 181) TaxID=331117 RepID=A1DBM2_NEOFI|nr:C6 zinc finger domain protein [Aspergillus fischeri NRRL 181]EAW20262.1 C6 zinc finger domain protein [Aspergillus fischeri NRRL 181]